MMEFLWNLSSFIIALGILITVHEYGHYWVAKKNGVKVERFSIGFGQPLWRKVDRHGTEFVIALIPLGGYVKMLDERIDNVSEQDKPNAFNNKSVYQRIAVVAAGPLANFIFAILCFYLMFLLGVPSVKPIVGDILPNSIAAQTAMTEQSEIIAVGEEPTQDWNEVNLALVRYIGDPEITLTYKSIDSASPRTVTLDTKEWQYRPDQISAYESLGFIPFQAARTNEVALVGKGSAAERYDIRVGDKLIAINGQSINNDWDIFSKQIKTFPEQEVLVTIERAGQALSLAVVPNAVERDGKKIGFIGIAPKVEPYPEEYLIDLAYGPIAAIGKSLDKTWDLITLSFDMIGKLLTGDVSVKNLSGPIGIAQGAGAHAGFGFVYFLGFLALISINLGIINILPVPVLDGGHLVYYLIELFTGKPVPEKVQEMGFKFGTILLLGLMGLALMNDFSRL
ncbi:sigma E protease regulator RseP [Thalassotalea ganghwensis]